jgi:hypothetical protein
MPVIGLDTDIDLTIELRSLFAVFETVLVSFFCFCEKQKRGNPIIEIKNKWQKKTFILKHFFITYILLKIINNSLSIYPTSNL